MGWALSHQDGSEPSPSQSIFNYLPVQTLRNIAQCPSITLRPIANTDPFKVLPTKTTMVDSSFNSTRKYLKITLQAQHILKKC